MLFVVAIASSSNHTDYNKAFALTNTSSASSSIPKAKQDTFSAIGTISSLVITVPESAAGFNITNAFKVILAGEWNLSVHKGNVTNFAKLSCLTCGWYKTTYSSNNKLQKS